VSVSFRGKERPRNGIVGFGRTRNEKRAIFRAAFDSRSSLFAPKPHGNACNACYIHLQFCCPSNLVPRAFKALGTRLLSFLNILSENKDCNFCPYVCETTSIPIMLLGNPPPPSTPFSSHSLTTGNPSSKYEHRRASALLRNIQNIRICMGKIYRFYNLRK